ncbi:hypothetical protein GO499_10475 [Algicella marina]|uniref:Uncharacterized protein n=2 Tax=Algicella marina TaxID=2683284 RepID=A0A6P1T6D7_9RHOB|nr:hypothetical protein GO499_10475 [Algicella marina]
MVDQLRDEIDRGGTGDKVAFLDPAAAPLGTDDEAAGLPPERARAAQAMATETVRGQAVDTKPGPADRHANHVAPQTIAIGVAVAVLVIALIFWLT